jgi:hypothetical protein
MKILLVILIAFDMALLYPAITAGMCCASGFKRGCWICKMLHMGKYRD